MASDDHKARLKEAAQWYAELQAPDAGAETWDAFRLWEQVPGNAAAFRDIEAALSKLDRALEAQAPKRRAAPLRWLGGLAAAAAVAAWIAVSAGLPPADIEPQIFATGVGEIREVALADGSSATLNTASRIEVEFARATRTVRLEKGQVLFEVAPGDAPFVVDAAGTRTRALGTQFEVYLKSGGAQVTLLEGSVSIDPDGPGAAQETVLSPGQRMVVASDGGVSLDLFDAGAAAAWRSGILQFKDVRLADAVEEVNRYSAIQIIIEDRSLEDERLSGTFRAGDPEAFVSALLLFFPVEVARSGERIWIVPAGG